MKISRFLVPLMLLVTVLASPAMGAEASMGISHANYCSIHGKGLVHGVKTWIDLKSPRAVTLDHLGLRPGGPFRRIADLAYTRIEAGVPLSSVESEVQRLCLSIPLTALEDDEPTFGEEVDGVGPQLCADVASSVAGFLVDEPGLRTAPVVEVLQALVPVNADRPLPHLGRAVELGQQRIRTDRDPKRLTDHIMNYCTGLSPAALAALDKEFYAQ